MGWEGWFTAAVIVVVLALLVRERVSAPLAVLGGVITFVLTGVLDPEQAFAGFSSEAPVTVAALFVLAGAAHATGALDVFVSASIGKPLERLSRPRRRELFRILVPAGLLSSVVYNTPTVGMLAPQVAAWARRGKRPPSWYLLPLNYAVLLGGQVTAVGTTTNAVANGLMVDAGMKPLGLLELTPYALPALVLGGVLLVALAPLLLPDRSVGSDEVQRDQRDFTLHAVVDPQGALVGKTVAEAGLRGLKGTYLVQLTRDTDVVAPVGPTEALQAGDQLTFVGNVGIAVDVQRRPGLLLADEGPPLESDAFFEAVLSQGSPLVGSTLKELDFRQRFDSAVVAIHRDGERLEGKLGEVRLRGGDVLLLLVAGDDMSALQRHRSHFLVVAPVDVTPPVRRERSRLVLVVVALFLVAVTTGLLDVIHAAIAAAVAVLALRIITPAQARASLDLDVLVTLCASFGLGAAVKQSGLAAYLAKHLVEGSSAFGHAGPLIGVLLATVVITQVVTNNAAAIIMFPIAVSTAAAAHQPGRPFVLAVIMASSMSYLTTFGYQTNLMVAGLAGYRARDFVPLGSALLVLSLVVTAPLLATQV
jgi:di/tricarboxylate transporter